MFTDGLDAMVHVSSRLVTYHRDSGLLRSWNTESGYLVWESVVELSAARCVQDVVQCSFKSLPSLNKSPYPYLKA